MNHRLLLMPALALMALGAAFVAPRLAGSTAAPSPEKAPSAALDPAGAGAGAGAGTGAQAVPPAPAVPGDAVQLFARLDRDAVWVDGERRVRAELTLSAPADDTLPPVPTHLVLAVDRSGSMNGDKILDAQAAARELAGQLVAGDQLTLVSFASEPTADLVASPEPTEWFAAIDRLTAGGSTNLRGALDVAAKQLLDEADIAQRAVLLSDGLPDARDGLASQARGFALQQAALSAVGIGLDYDEGLLQGLADAGAGNFYWTTRGPELAAVLTDELDTARETVASSVELRYAAPGRVQLEDAAGYLVVGDRFTVGSLYAGQTRRLWVTLRLAPGVAPGDVPMGAFEATWTTPEGDRRGHTASLGAVGVVREEAVALQAVDVPTWERGVVEEEFNHLRKKVSAAVQRRDEAGAKQELAAFKAQHEKLAAVTGSAKVAQQLDEVEALEREVNDNFAPAATDHSRNVWSKGVSTKAYQKRRAGQAKGYGSSF